MIVKCCDICGQKIYRTDNWYKLRGWFCTYSQYFRVDICMDCSRENKRLVEEKRKQEIENE